MISGFTDLTEALAKRGREGAEEIAGVVDAAFAELIRRAYAQHADLLKFGGDAILLLFRGDDHPQRTATAAVGMQEGLAAMRRRATSAGPVRLRMSIGISDGQPSASELAAEDNAATTAKGHGVRIVPLGVGSASTANLQAWASQRSY